MSVKFAALSPGDKVLCGNKVLTYVSYIGGWYTGKDKNDKVEKWRTTTTHTQFNIIYTTEQNTQRIVKSTQKQNKAINILGAFVRLNTSSDVYESITVNESGGVVGGLPSVTSPIQPTSSSNNSSSSSSRGGEKDRNSV